MQGLKRPLKDGQEEVWRKDEGEEIHVGSMCLVFKWLGLTVVVLWELRAGRVTRRES